MWETVVHVWGNCFLYVWGNCCSRVGKQFSLGEGKLLATNGKPFVTCGNLLFTCSKHIMLTGGENYFLLMWENCCSRVVICWSGVRKLLSTWLKLLFKCSRVGTFCSRLGGTVHVKCEYIRGSHWFLIILVYSHDIDNRHLFWVNG